MSYDLSDPRLDGVIITLRDVSEAGHCVSGARQWFEHYGFDFRSVVKVGVPARDLIATQDALALRVVKYKLNKKVS